MWRVVSSGFLHFGIFHLGMNMLLLWQLGSLLEPALGRARFLLLYLASLVGGATGAILLSPNALTGGASGAVFGLMGAAAVALLRRGVNPMALGDVAISSVFVGIMFGRLGCLMHGCCYGDLCDLPWSIRFPEHSVPFEALVSRGLLDRTAQASQIGRAHV